MASFPRSFLLLSSLGLTLASCQAAIPVPVEGRISHLTAPSSEAFRTNQHPGENAGGAQGQSVPSPSDPTPRTAETTANPLVPIGLPIASRPPSPPATPATGKPVATEGQLSGRVTTYEDRIDRAAIEAFGWEFIGFSASTPMAFDQQGNAYFALRVATVMDVGRILVKVTRDGTNLYYRPDQGWTKSAPQFYRNPHGAIAAEADGRLYFTFPSSENLHLYRISADGKTMDTFKGSPFIESLTIDSRGNVYFPVHPANAPGLLPVNSLCRLTPDGKLEAVAGGGAKGSTDGRGAAASFNSPNAAVVEPSGNILVSELSDRTGEGYRLRRVTPDGIVTTIRPRLVDEPSKPDLVNIFGIAVDAKGTIYICDGYRNAVYCGTERDGVLALKALAGTPGASGNVDGTGAKARFKSPHQLVWAGPNRLLVIDDGNRVIRQIQ